MVRERTRRTKGVKTPLVDPKAKERLLAAAEAAGLDSIEELLRRGGLAPATAQARAQILYWTFLGFALSGPSITAARLQPVLDELMAMISRQ